MTDYLLRLPEGMKKAAQDIAYISHITLAEWIRRQIQAGLDIASPQAKPLPPSKPKTKPRSNDPSDGDYDPCES